MVVGYHHFRKPPYGYFWVPMLDVWTWMLHDLNWSLDSQGYQFQGVKRKNVSLRFYTSGVDVEKGVNVFWKIHDSLQAIWPPKNTQHFFFVAASSFVGTHQTSSFFILKAYISSNPPQKNRQRPPLSSKLSRSYTPRFHRLWNPTGGFHQGDLCTWLGSVTRKNFRLIRIWLLFVSSWKT